MTKKYLYHVQIEDQPFAQVEAESGREAVKKTIKMLGLEKFSYSSIRARTSVKRLREV